MPKLISKEMKKAIQEQVHMKAAEELSEKDIDQLIIMLRSEAMVKALGGVYRHCVYIPAASFRENPATAEGARAILQAQGRVDGLNLAIDTLLELITIQDEDEGEEQ